MAEAVETPVPEGNGRVLEEGLREVAGTDLSFAACIADGSVPKPKIQDWQDWLKMAQECRDEAKGGPRRSGSNDLTSRVGSVAIDHAAVVW